MVPSDTPIEGEKNIERALFLLIFLSAWHGMWLLYHADPGHFLTKAQDNLAYYQWLPGAFVNGNFDGMPWAHRLENGMTLSLVTLGVALLQMPFYLIGHWAAHLFDYPMDGYTAPFAVANMASTAFYVGLGGVLTYRLARRMSDPISALLAVILLFAATNLFYYTVYEPGYSHAYSFFSIALLCWTTLCVIEGGSTAAVFGWICCSSLVVLIRQLNVVTLVFPAVMIWRSPGGFSGFVQHLLRYRGTLLLAVIIALVPWVLQMMYWYRITGEVITFTYGKKGEGFDFAKMVPGMVLFSPRTGWLVYTPIMIPVMIVLVRRAWKRHAAALAVLFIVMVTVLLYSAWWSWWLGSSYGARGLVDLYALMAIPLAWLVRGILRRSWSVRLIAGVFFVACIQLNFGLMERFSWQWSHLGWEWRNFFEEVSKVVTAEP